MTRTEYLAYIIKSFKRTDKNDELIDALNDTLYDLSTLYGFQVSQTKTEITLLDSTYIYTYPVNYAIMVSDIRFIDTGGGGRKLTKLDKPAFDAKYPDIESSTFITGDPYDYTIYGNQIFIAPYIKTITTEQLFISGSTVATELGASDSPDYKDRWREIIKFGTLYRAYNDLKQYEDADRFLTLYKGRILDMQAVDEVKGGSIDYVKQATI